MSLIPSTIAFLATQAHGLPIDKQLGTYANANANATTAMTTYYSTDECPRLRRSVLKIVWSCLATIFACTWVSIHPNIPHPEAGSRSILWTRFTLFICGVIAPEWIVVLAMRQYYMAQIFVRELQLYHNVPLTLTQSFFSQMGGLMLCDEARRPLGILHHTNVDDLLSGRDGGKYFSQYINCDEVSFRIPDDEELWDRSKSDWVAKMLTCVQTLWFLGQCLLRWRYRLPVTEIEIITIAFACINGVTYYLWWYKPQDVRFAERVVWHTYVEIPPNMPARPGHTFSQYWRELQGISGLWWKDLPSIPTRIKFALESFKREYQEAMGDGEMAIPMISTGLDADDGVFPVLAGSCAIGMLFGAIHLGGWQLSFPTSFERTTWHISAIAITLIPGFVMLWRFYVDRTLTQIEEGRVYVYKVKKPYIFPAIKWTAICTIPLYIAARVALISIAVSSLRSVSPRAKYELSWNEYIPHI